MERSVFTSSYSLCAKILSVGCDGVRVCDGELCPRHMYHIYKNLWDASVGEELPLKKDSGNEMDPYAVAVMRRSTIIGHVPRKISAACLQVLSQIRDRGTVIKVTEGISGHSPTFTLLEQTAVQHWKVQR